MTKTEMTKKEISGIVRYPQNKAKRDAKEEWKDAKTMDKRLNAIEKLLGLKQTE